MISTRNHYDINPKSNRYQITIKIRLRKLLKLSSQGSPGQTKQGFKSLRASKQTLIRNVLLFIVKTKLCCRFRFSRTGKSGSFPLFHIHACLVSLFFQPSTSPQGGSTVGPGSAVAPPASPADGLPRPPRRSGPRPSARPLPWKLRRCPAPCAGRAAGARASPGACASRRPPGGRLSSPRSGAAPPEGPAAPCPSGGGLTKRKILYGKPGGNSSQALGSGLMGRNPPFSTRRFCRQM